MSGIYNFSGFSYNYEKIRNNGVTAVTFANAIFDGQGLVNAALQLNVRNGSNGATASSDLVATADTGTDSTNYVNVGINGSAYSVGTWTINGALDSYLYSNGGSLAIGTDTATKILVFFTGGTLLANRRMRIQDASINADVVFFPQQAPTASAPAYVLGGMYFDTTLNKLRIGGATGWETVTSV